VCSHSKCNPLHLHYCTNRILSAHTVSAVCYIYNISLTSGCLLNEMAYSYNKRTHYTQFYSPNQKKVSSRKSTQLPTQVQNIATTNGGHFTLWLQEITCEFRTGGILYMADVVVTWCTYIHGILYKRQVHLWYCYEKDGDTGREAHNWTQCVCGRTSSRYWHLVHQLSLQSNKDAHWRNDQTSK
jgi:hypothetical protein